MTVETSPSYRNAFVETTASSAVAYSGKDCAPGGGFTGGGRCAHLFEAVAVGTTRFVVEGGSDVVCITVEKERWVGGSSSTPAVPQTPPINRPGRTASQLDYAAVRAMELRDGRSSDLDRREPGSGRAASQAKWSLPVGMLVAARATETTLHAAAATGHPVGRPDQAAGEIMVPAVLPPPSIQCNIRRRSLAAKASPPVQRSPVSTKKPRQSVDSTPFHLGASAPAPATGLATGFTSGVASKLVDTQVVVTRERSPSAVASDGSMFVARDLAEVKAAQLRQEGDSASGQGDSELAREKYNMAARLVEESSPLGVELRRQLATDSNSPDPAGQRVSTTAASGGGLGARHRRTPRRLLSPRAIAAAAAAAASAPTAQHLQSVPWVGTDGGTPRRPTPSDDDSPVVPSPKTPVVQGDSSPLENNDKAAVVTTGQFGASLATPQVGLTVFSRRLPVPRTQSAADAAAAIACDAAAAACDAAAAAADASRKGRAQALEEQLRAAEPLLARKMGNPIVNLDSPRQLRRAEEELEDRIDTLQRCV